MAQPSITVKCALHSVNNGHTPISLPNNQAVIIGRGPATKITDKRCSRNQVSLVANTDRLEVKVQQLGDNKTGINGSALAKNESRVLKHGDRLEVLLGEHEYRVEFDPAPSGGACAKRPHSPVEAGSRDAKKGFLTGGEGTEGSWDTLDDGKLLVYTPHGLGGRRRVAAYDLDHTVITTKSGRVFPKDIDDWKIAYDSVPGKLKELYNDGYKIVLLTNQAGITSGKLKIKDFKTKVHNVVRRLGVPIQTFVSTGVGIYRKPAPGMWNVLTERMNDDVPVDVAGSFYCGDAAGRVADWAPKRKKDFSVSDRLFALNVGLRFYTPEEYFLGQGVARYQLPEFDPTSFSADLTLCDPPTAAITSDQQEVVILVGYPGSGKSFFTRHHMVPAGYTHVNRDTLGSWQQCVAAAETALRGGKSVIVDNTNPTRETRHKFVEVASRAGVACRCFVLGTSKEHSRHNNRFRELRDEAHEKVTDMVINMYRSKYEEPARDEGFKEILKINFVPEFTDSALEKLYKMYLL